ncbi:hypothetical protein PHLCEN_2v3523 [Hermanssonia centrifuga]|uniref:Uncharacterized protein n=1 Tax=Hermanssonia centrifuga TaxID=98765 RepID=A0A2R6QEZ9_9APHY|nr:hypothetical protein PHLCEN_2v3523 [Hermanssonia centrifuga]
MSILNANFHTKPYEYSGLAFEELPHLAKYYLEEIVGITSPADVPEEHIENEISKLFYTLFRTLQGNDMALVEELWGQTQAGPAVAKIEPTTPRSLSPPETQATEENVSQLRIETLLLPEREMLMSEFITKFDALVWLLMEQDDETKKLSVPEQQEFRDKRCYEAVRYTEQALLSLSQAVMQKHQAKVSSELSGRQVFMDNRQGRMNRREIEPTRNWVARTGTRRPSDSQPSFTGLEQREVRTGRQRT